MKDAGWADRLRVRMVDTRNKIAFVLIGFLDGLRLHVRNIKYYIFILFHNCNNSVLTSYCRYRE
jgi:hypothetical protein